MSQAGKPIRITAERIEVYLDRLAEIMADSRPEDAELGLPLWNRLTAELERRREAEAVILAARERARLSRDRTEARSA